MSAYLDRLADTIDRPARRVQPLLGSLFAKDAGSDREVHARGGRAGGQVAVIPVSDHAAQTRNESDVHEVSEHAEDRDQSLVASLPRRSTRLMAERAIEPSAGSTASAGSTGMGGEHSAAQGGHGLIAASVAGRPADKPIYKVSGEVLVNAHAQARAGSRSDLSDRGEATEDSKAKAQVTPRAAATLLPAVRTVPPQATRQGAGERKAQQQTDDIQIRIGRIEVIAVQSASRGPATTAAAPKGPTLSDYLQRRDRRSR